jgi:hypothetical protein
VELSWNDAVIMALPWYVTGSIGFEDCKDRLLELKPTGSSPMASKIHKPPITSALHVPEETLIALVLSFQTTLCSS